MKIIAAIEHHSVIAKITPLGLPARAPPRSPARSFVFVYHIGIAGIPRWME